MNNGQFTGQSKVSLHEAHRQLISSANPSSTSKSHEPIDIVVPRSTDTARVADELEARSNSNSKAKKLYQLDLPLRAEFDKTVGNSTKRAAAHITDSDYTELNDWSEYGVTNMCPDTVKKGQSLIFSERQASRDTATKVWAAAASRELASVPHTKKCNVVKSGVSSNGTGLKITAGVGVAAAAAVAAYGQS